MMFLGFNPKSPVWGMVHQGFVLELLAVEWEKLLAEAEEKLDAEARDGAADTGEPQGWREVN